MIYELWTRIEGEKLRYFVVNRQTKAIVAVSSSLPAASAALKSLQQFAASQGVSRV